MYAKAVKSNDAWVMPLAERQVTDPDSRYYGGTIDPVNGIAWPNHSVGTAASIAIWAAAIVNPDSVYYFNKPIMARLSLAISYMLRMQHADGTISPGWTNFHSPPDTAFIVVGLAQVYELLVQKNAPELTDAAAELRTFLAGAIPAMLTGGCHTPNHRWVLAAALGWLNKLFGLPEAVARAELWLAEGMDITPDGEWTERSNGIYNAVSDIMLIHAARLLGKPELLAAVRSNLSMMTHLVHPNGEIVTEYSGRQDYGVTHTLESYLLPYAIMAQADGSSLFEALAEQAADALSHPGGAANNAAVLLLLEPGLRQRAVRPSKLPERYDVLINSHFPRVSLLSRLEAKGTAPAIRHSSLHREFGAPVARYRDGEISATLMTETPSFFSLRHGALRLLALEVSTQFMPGPVPMNSLQRTESGWELAAEQRKGYYGPLAEEHLPAAPDPSNPWYLLSHHERPLTHEQRLELQVDVGRLETGWQIRIRADKPSDCMTQLAWVFGEETRFSQGQLTELWRTGAGSAQRWTGGAVICEAGGDRLELTGAACEHTLVSVRGASSAEQCHTLLVNVMTPFDYTFTLRQLPAAGIRGE